MSAVERMVAQARVGLVRLEPAVAARAVRDGALLVDIRPHAQRCAEGGIPGAVVIERNVLEWRFDPSSPWRHPQLEDPPQLVVVICSEGFASSLAAATLQQLGLVHATDVVGGVHAWVAAGLPTVPARSSTGDLEDPDGTAGARPQRSSWADW
jgi:rhodanese-related sulfurtransferase